MQHAASSPTPGDSDALQLEDFHLSFVAIDLKKGSSRLHDIERESTTAYSKNLIRRITGGEYPAGSSRIVGFEEDRDNAMFSELLYYERDFMEGQLLITFGRLRTECYEEVFSAQHPRGKLTRGVQDALRANDSVWKDGDSISYLTDTMHFSTGLDAYPLPTPLVLYAEPTKGRDFSEFDASALDRRCWPLVQRFTSFGGHTAILNPFELFCTLFHNNTEAGFVFLSTKSSNVDDDEILCVPDLFYNSLRQLARFHWLRNRATEIAALPLNKFNTRQLIAKRDTHSIGRHYDDILESWAEYEERFEVLTGELERIRLENAEFEQSVEQMNLFNVPWKEAFPRHRVVRDLLEAPSSASARLEQGLKHTRGRIDALTAVSRQLFEVVAMRASEQLQHQMLTLSRHMRLLSILAVGLTLLIIMRETPGDSGLYDFLASVVLAFESR